MNKHIELWFIASEGRWFGFDWNDHHIWSVSDEAALASVSHGEPEYHMVYWH